MGLPIAEWFFEHAKGRPDCDVVLFDLKTIALPMLDEPNHPRLSKYQFDHTKAWSTEIRKTDAFVFVTPEYNYGSPPALVNALNYLFHEWHYKAVGFVSYGGISGGLRSVQMTKQIVTALKMMPIPESVTIPFATNQMDSGVFKAAEANVVAANTMLDELMKWTSALRTLRPNPA